MNNRDLLLTPVCDICGSREVHYAFSLNLKRALRCVRCGFIFIDRRSEEHSPRIGYEGSADVSDDVVSDCTPGVNTVVFNRYLDLLVSSGGEEGGTLLQVGCDSGDFLVEAALRGFKVTGLSHSHAECEIARDKISRYGGEVIQGQISDVLDRNVRFDYLVFLNILETVHNPRSLLRLAHELLRPDGYILCLVSTVNTSLNKVTMAEWAKFGLKNLSCFDSSSLRSLIFQENFSNIKSFSLSSAFVNNYNNGVELSPSWFRATRNEQSTYPLKSIAASPAARRVEIGVIARKGMKSEMRRLTVIMPVFNEVTTVKAGIERVLSKQIEGIDLDLILIESNSNDGTRDIVKDYLSHSRVTVIFEAEPKGKGHAVRSGLKAATGDFILIQDGDDEYDIEDYDALIEPLRDGRQVFVLGARHGGGGWKMRSFSDQPFRAFVLNMGHWVFTGLVNAFYGVWLRDPFTMYKVFRRDCIDGIEFECNRFDFDYELLIKLIRRGFIPVEIPVNYRSRSFLEGKKVRIFADPVTWIKAIVKYRFVKI